MSPALRRKRDSSAYHAFSGMLREWAQRLGFKKMN